MQLPLLATRYGGLCIFSKCQKLFDSLGYKHLLTQLDCYILKQAEKGLHTPARNIYYWQGIPYCSGWQAKIAGIVLRSRICSTGFALNKTNNGIIAMYAVLFIQSMCLVTQGK